MIDKNRSPGTQASRRDAAAGTLALGFGVLVILARAMETAYTIPGMPRSWHQNDWLWWLLGLFSAGLGGHLLVRSEVLDLPGVKWNPTQPGRRFRELVLYTREGCHLCEDAAETLRAHDRWLPAITLVDIDSDAGLIERYGTCVPVLSLDGKVRFRGKVNETLLRRLIEGTPPIPIADI